MKNCKVCVVAEGQKTKSKAFGMSRWVVQENSARFPGLGEILPLRDADHKTVCKPQNPQDAGYLKLISCIRQVIQEHSSSVSVHLHVEPIGIGGKIDEVCRGLESRQVSVVGLFGMGGVGKTTLSKKVYNKKAAEYAKSCYLEEVKSKKVEDVQKQLLQELCAEKLGQNDIVRTHHLDKIKKCFAMERVLVVFDDVTSRECLEALQVFWAFEPESQSKVIVTGRDRGILPKAHVISGKASIVSVDGIRDEEGSDMQLFAQYAFKYVDEGVKERVRARFQKLADDIVKLCNGLPLSLEVIGAYLGTEYERDDEEDLCRWTRLWRDAHEKLQTAQSLDGSIDDKLWSSLRVSYDGLAPLERVMFLDFACIFSGYVSGLVSGYVDQSMDLCKGTWDSESGVQNLLNKSLLKERKDVFGEAVFFMHDQLRDMGRYLLWKEVVKERPLYLLEGESHFFNGVTELKDCTNDWGVPLVASLEQGKGSQTPPYYSKLRMLHVRGCYNSSLLSNCLSECSRELRWLYLWDSRFTKVGIQKLGLFKGLRVLEILQCYDLEELPLNMGTALVDLVQLRLEKCHLLRSLPSSVGMLKKLKVFRVEECRGLESIPFEVGDLTQLEELSFKGCLRLKGNQMFQLGCANRIKELRLPFVPKICLPACPQLEQLLVESFTNKFEEFPFGFFTVDMPKLQSLKVYFGWSGKVLLHNPDGSVLVVVGKNYARLDVIRDFDGSIQKLQ